MCGISGIFEFDGGRIIPRDIVHRMNEAIRHRGPDDEGIFVDAGIGLGHRRLSIIDVAGGHQPLCNEDESVWVLLNGEIYNYPELSSQLIARGHMLRTKSDTEVIVHLYEDFGTECFSRLRGMFAVAIWDSRLRKLILARDRVGKKPLFYCHTPERLLFGSELKALLAGGPFARELDTEALSDYFSFGYIPAPKTIYRAVRKILPGHYVEVTGGGMHDVAYWDLSFASVEQRSEAEWCEIVRDQVREATQVRLMSEVPLGAFLSGGADSSSVVATMSQIMRRAVTTCSIGFEEQEYNEAEYARQVARLYATDHHEEIVRPEAVDVIDKLVWHYDEPFADSSAVPTYYVSRAARRHVTVALGGDGGDENFAGYRRYLFDRFENRLRSFLPLGVRRAVFGPLGRAYPGLSWAPRMFRAKATFQSLARSPLEGYFNSISCFRPDEKPKVFTPDFRKHIAGYESIDVLREYYERCDTTDPLSRIQYVDVKTYLPDDILVKVDRASMAVALELRAPLLDHKLMETVARIPSDLKLKGKTGKYIFKKAFEPMLPGDILYRSKQGFAVPLDRWFRRELRDMAYDAIFGHNDGILDHGYLRKLWDDHQANRYNRSRYLWSVLMFRRWQARFND